MKSKLTILFTFIFILSFSVNIHATEVIHEKINYNDKNIQKQMKNNTLKILKNSHNYVQIEFCSNFLAFNKTHNNIENLKRLLGCFIGAQDINWTEKANTLWYKKGHLLYHLNEENRTRKITNFINHIYKQKQYKLIHFCAKSNYLNGIPDKNRTYQSEYLDNGFSACLYLKGKISLNYFHLSRDKIIRVWDKNNTVTKLIIRNDWYNDSIWKLTNFETRKYLRHQFLYY